ncbi:MAG: CvpA family protein [Oscillospiraceae bacterium]|nr:CvpA family protein [Oscillospiraceae bacterium]
MGIFVDITILGIIALCTFIGYKRGLIKASIRILSFFIAIIVALLLYRPVAGIIIEHTNLGNSIQSGIAESILPEGVDPDDEVEVDESLLGVIGDGLDNVAQTTVNNISEVLAIQIIELGVLLVIFVTVKIGLRFVTALTDFITKIPILKQFNEVGGIIYGLVQGVLTVYTILAVIFLLSPIIDESFTNIVTGSILGGFLYNNNIFIMFLF